MRKSARVFEHDTLRIGEQGLTQSRFDALVRYNDRHQKQFFTVGSRSLHFCNFVGVLQVGTLTIEILPKADKRSSRDANKWQRALLQMLRQVGELRGDSAPEANLSLRNTSLLDIYITTFLDEVQQLTHAGLAKKYRRTEGNLFKMKGRILFRQQVTRNLLHRERVYTSHETYDLDNVLNRLLKHALELVTTQALRPSLTSRAAALAQCFEDVTDSVITGATFDRLVFDRATERYRTSIQLARLIILNYSPDLRGGAEHVMAILFDMNRLFERFILIQIKRARGLLATQLRIDGQSTRKFWGRSPLRPDIVAFRENTDDIHMILDTKWKIPNNNTPAANDLRQMYAYNLHFGATRSVLVYPRADVNQRGNRQNYYSSVALPGYQHECETYFVDLFEDNGTLRRDIGETLIRDLMAF